MKYFFEKPRNQITIQHNSTLDFDAHLHTEAEIGYCKEGSSVLYIEDKRFELVKNARELLQLIYNSNYVLNENNKALPILNNYDNEDEVLIGRDFAQTNRRRKYSSCY